MTIEGAQIAGATAAAGAVRDWQGVRADGDIQYAPLPPFKPPETPDWLRLLDEWLRALLEPVGRAIGLSWPVVEQALIAFGALGLIFLLWRIAGPLIARWRAAGRDVAEEWTPDRTEAEVLLDEADRLAAEGRYGEAVHLLLRRSVGHIAQARPDWLLPASTAREIAAFPMLSERARTAFSTLAARVERSIFALRDLDADDWTAARSAYADFALADLSA